MHKTNPSVDGYIRKSPEWQEELKKLRGMILDSGLTEEVKWRVPCYTLEGKVVIFLGRFKEACVISFAKGALLKDAKGILIQQTANSQAVRIIRLSSLQQIGEMERVLRAYIGEAAEVEKAGLKVKLKKITEWAVPAELRKKMKEMPALKKAFEALTPGRQRGYFMFVAGAKQEQTRVARVEKCVPRILAGKGLDDE